MADAATDQLERPIPLTSLEPVHSDGDSVSDTEPLANDAGNRAALLDCVRERRDSANRWTKFWSSIHHLFLFGGALISGLATYAISAKWAPFAWDAQHFAAALTSAATLVTALAASGGFSSKWRACTRAFSRLRILVINAEDPGVSTREIRRELTSVLRELDLQIVDASSATVDGSDASARSDETARKPKPKPA